MRAAAAWAVAPVAMEERAHEKDFAALRAAKCGVTPDPIFSGPELLGVKIAAAHRRTLGLVTFRRLALQLVFASRATESRFGTYAGQARKLVTVSALSLTLSRRRQNHWESCPACG